MIGYIREHLLEQKPADLLHNLKGNWYITVSSAAYLYLNGGNDDLYLYTVPVSVLLILILSVLVPPVPLIKGRSRAVNIFSLVNAICICIGLTSRSSGISGCILAVIAVPAVFLMNMLFWNRLLSVLREMMSGLPLNKAEVIIYVLIFTSAVAVTSYFFARSTAFYDQDTIVDIIYTGDSPTLINNNAYLFIDSSQNDIRQPLFGLLSAPFAGIPSALHLLFSQINYIFFLNPVQILMMITANIILASEISSTRMQRICFMIITCFTHTFMLFSLMEEQYITAYFWLVLAICLINRKKKGSSAASYAAAGSLLTGMVLIPFAYPSFSFKAVRQGIRNTIIRCIEFVFLLVLFGRLSTLIESIESFIFYRLFMGRGVGYTDRLLQYLNFARSIYIAPASEIRDLGFRVSWQLPRITWIDITGILILLLVFVCFWFTRKNGMSKISLCWIIFSFIILIGVGWGTSENGLILYSLYFSWAFSVLIFNLMKLIDEKLDRKPFLPAVTAVISITLLLFNIPAFMDMLDFAVTYYPVR
ncbi:MAG: hypothetical protein IKE53_04790 [Clostridiales bacterium]|nr:hypothetical protein [Clostridiales bacterium]